jgi:tripartite-type tricarboxylate transporter receptor subunit TctC
MMRRRVFLVSAAATCLGPGLVGAQGAWPQRPISLVVPFSAGGSADLVARMFAQHFQAKYGVSVVIENKGGAGGSIGSAKARREQLLTMIPKEAIGPYLAHNSGYDFSKLPARFKLTELNKQIAAANASPVGFVYKLANALGGDPEISREEFFEYGLRHAICSTWLTFWSPNSSAAAASARPMMARR